ncbi:ubiquitin-like domain-containing protein [Streptomyces sp. NPDC047022]|uniref:ubiquitin-like domain-containing protein n=1 Tax=Streptomyces sp. NPDC047022 TaxID=3155737 RepID=UPI0033C00CA2
MSKRQYSPYGTYEPPRAYGDQQPQGRGHPDTDHQLYAQAYPDTDHSPYTQVCPDTYRASYEARVRAARAGQTQAQIRPPQTWQPPQARQPLPRPDTEGGGPAATGPRAQARHAAHRRKSRKRPDPMRRLLPQALVVAFLAGGTTAFVAKDKAVELMVDGRPRILHTFADDVGELLAHEGISVGRHDVVAPSLGTPIASGDEIAVRFGRPVVLTIDGRRRRLWTTAPTVDGALQQLGVRAEGAYVSTSRSRRIGRQGLELDVRTQRSVTVMADGQARTIRTNAATVREAVEQAGVTLHGQDTTSAAPESFPSEGETVTVLRVKGSEEIREEPIPFEVQRTRDASLFQGTVVVARAGRPGTRRVTYVLRTVNGVRQEPLRIGSEVVEQPQTQLVRVGAKARPASVAGAEALNWNRLADCESGGKPGAVDPSGTYGGLYQFDRPTWRSLGGSGRPEDAPAEEQTYRAKKLYVRQGTSPWPHCGHRLYR